MNIPTVLRLLSCTGLMLASSAVVLGDEPYTRAIVSTDNQLVPQSILPLPGCSDCDMCSRWHNSFNRTRLPRINHSDHQAVAFISLVGFSPTNLSANVLALRRSGFETVAAASDGTPAPGVTDHSLRLAYRYTNNNPTLSDFTLGPADEVVFGAALFDDTLLSNDNHAALRWFEGDLDLLFKGGDALPGSSTFIIDPTITNPTTGFKVGRNYMATPISFVDPEHPELGVFKAMLATNDLNGTPSLEVVLAGGDAITGDISVEEFGAFNALRFTISGRDCAPSDVNLLVATCSVEPSDSVNDFLSTDSVLFVAEHGLSTRFLMLPSVNASGSGSYWAGGPIAHSSSGCYYDSGLDREIPFALPRALRQEGEGQRDGIWSLLFPLTSGVDARQVVVYNGFSTPPVTEPIDIFAYAVGEPTYRTSPLLPLSPPAAVIGLYTYPEGESTVNRWCVKIHRDQSDVTTIACEGDELPDESGDVFINSASAIAMNSGNDVAFLWNARHTEGESFEDYPVICVYRSDSTFTVVARGGSDHVTGSVMTLPIDHPSPGQTVNIASGFFSPPPQIGLVNPDDDDAIFTSSGLGTHRVGGGADDAKRLWFNDCGEVVFVATYFPPESGGLESAYVLASPRPVCTFASPSRTVALGTAPRFHQTVILQAHFEVPAGTSPTFQWYKDNTAVTLGSGISMGPDNELIIDSFGAGDAGTYQLKATPEGTTCGVVASPPIEVESSGFCIIDFNMDGNTDPDDLGDFISAYFSSPPVFGPGGYSLPCCTSGFLVWGHVANYVAFKTGRTTAGDIITLQTCQTDVPNPDDLGDFIGDFFTFEFDCD